VLYNAVTMPAAPTPQLASGLASLLFFAAVVGAAPPPAPKKPAAKVAPKQAKPGAKPPDRTKPAPLGARGVPAAIRPKPGGPDRIGEPAAGGRQPASQIPAVRPVSPGLTLRADLDFDPRADWKPDAVALGRPGAPAEELERLIQAWKLAGAPAQRVLSALVDPEGRVSSGRAGTPALGDLVERDAAGNPLGGVNPELTPAAGWLAHLKEQVRRSLDAGAEGIWLHEPAPAGAGGRSPAFKAAWRDAYGADWTDPAASPAAFFRGARLRADLSLAAVNDLLRFTRDYAREKGRAAGFMVSTRAPSALAAEGRVFPLSAISRLPLDGIAGRLTIEDAARPLPHEGRMLSLPFESAWMMATHLGSTVEGLPDKTLLLAPEAAGAAGELSPDYQRLLPQLYAASLFAWQARGYVLPDPLRLSVPTPGAEVTPGDADFLTVLCNLAGALKEIPAGEAPEWLSGGARGIGVLTLDSLGFQSGGPLAGSLRALHGQVLPLLRRGVPVQLVPAERVADPGYLSRYKVLLLSFEMQKPLGPELAQGLAEWVKGGGTLVYFANEDPYNAVGEWWNRNGLASPADHLVRQCNAGVDPLQRLVRQVSARYREALKPAGPPRAWDERQTLPLALSGLHRDGQAVYLRFADLTPTDGDGVRLGRVRVLEGERVRADFVAGGPGERAFLVEDAGSVTAPGRRGVDGEGGFVYRFTRLGREARLELELAGNFSISVAAGDDPAANLKPATPTLAPVRVPSGHAISTYALNGAQPLFTIPESSGPDTAAVWFSPHGLGGLLYSGVPASFGADSAAGAEFVRSVVRHACVRASLEYSEGPLIARRGAYVVAHALGRTARLPGQYLDLLQAELPLVENPALPYREAALFKQVKLAGRVPTVLHASHRARVQEATAARTRIALDGPTGLRGVLRVFPAGMSLTGLDAVDAQGKAVPVDVRPDGRTLRLRYPQQSSGITLTLRWLRPEARLTK
jgi:hypothetical protein